MNLAPSDQQLEIANAAASFLSRELGIDRIRELAGDPERDTPDSETWKRGAKLGWLGLAIPEDAGGLGLGLAEEVLLFRELGRHLAPGPFLSCIIAARIAWQSGAASLAGEIISGERRVGMALGELAIDLRPEDLLLELHAGIGSIFEVASATPTAGVDPVKRYVRPVRGKTVAVMESTALMDRARVLTAAELLGIIEAVRDMSASYAKSRVQFGQPIGAFQAVKHRCADMAIAAYSTVGEVFQAALLVEAGTADGAFHAATAYMLASRSAMQCTADNIQNHGGIGFTWECDAHLFLKRALVLERLLGDRRDISIAILKPARHEF